LERFGNKVVQGSSFKSKPELIKLEEVQRTIKKSLLELDVPSAVLIVIPVLFFSFFLILPILSILSIAFSFKGSFSLKWFSEIFSSEFYVNLKGSGEFFKFFPDYNLLYITGIDYGVIPNSLFLAFSVTVMSSILGTALAFILARYDFYGKNLIRILSMFPLLLAPFISAHVIKKLLDPYSGLLNWLLFEVLHIIPFRIYLDGLAAIALVQVITYYPIVMLNVYSSLMNIDPSLEEQAENLGAKGFELFRKVTLPLSFPGLMAGSMLVFIFSLEDLSAPIVFHGHPLARKLISFYIYSSFIRETGERSPEIAALCFILLAIALSIFFFIRNYVSMRTYATISRSRLNYRITRLSIRKNIVILLLILPVVLFTALPQIGVFLLAFSSRWVSILPEGFTVKNIVEVFSNPKISRYLLNSFSYASISIVLIFIISMASSYVSNRVKLPGVQIIDMLITSPIAIPGIVVAMGYFYFFATYFKGTVVDPLNVFLFNPGPILVLGYVVRRLPFAARSFYAGLQQVHTSLDEAAMMLGAGRFAIIRKIIIPLILLNILSGLMISFIYVVGEVSISIIIGVLNQDYAPMTVYMRDVWLSAAGSEQIAATLGFMLMSLQLLVISVITFLFKQSYAFISGV